MKIWPTLPGMPKMNRRSIGDFFASKKEGVVTGAADNDPSGLVTYLQVGAITGFSQLWLLVLSTPCLIVVEEMSSRVGAVLKKGLGRVLVDHYGMKIAFFFIALVALANIATISADLAGMASILAIIFNMQSYHVLFVFLLGFITVLVLLRGNYQSISRYLFLLTPIFLAYVVSAFLAKPDWAVVLSDTVLPKIKFDLSYWSLAVAMLGTTITPYVMFWETTEEVEEGRKVTEIETSKISIRTGMIFSNIMAAFMVILAATVLFGRGGAIEDLHQAGEVLRPALGNASFGMFSLGILGAGLLAVPVLASTTAYMIADTFRFKAGLDNRQDRAPAFYMVILLAILVAIGVSAVGINPIKMLISSQILNGLVVPFLILGVYRIVNDRKLMGQYISSWRSNFVAVLTVLVIAIADFFMILGWFK